MSRRIPPSTVSVRRIVSDILNMTLGSQADWASAPQLQRTVPSGHGEFQKLPLLFASGQLRAASRCKEGTYNETSSKPEVCCVRAPDLSWRQVSGNLIGNADGRAGKSSLN